VYDCVISHPQNTTALQSNVFLTGMHRLLVTDKGQLVFLIANPCQSHLQTAQLVTLSGFTQRFRETWCVYLHEYREEDGLFLGHRNDELKP
jgi:hypothetical protein